MVKHLKYKILCLIQQVYKYALKVFYIHANEIFIEYSLPKEFPILKLILFKLSIKIIISLSIIALI